MANSIIPPLKWHGGKQYLAKRLIARMPPHVHYVEPFAGGLAVLFEKNPEGVSEVINDLNGALTNFWDTLRDENTFQRFARLAEATPFSEATWRASADWLAHRSADSDRVLWAFHFFVHCRQSMSGRMASFAPLSKRRTRRGMNEQASAWLGVVDGLREVHQRLRRVVIRNRSALEILESEDSESTLFYLDPPYVHETRSTTYEYGANEMAYADHEALLQKLTTIKGRFLLSGYANELYDGYAVRHGWALETFELPNNAAAGPTKRRMTEVVWMNFTPPTPGACPTGDSDAKRR